MDFGYRNLADALQHYQDRGYYYMVDVPWTVGLEAYYATKPKDAGPDITMLTEGSGTPTYPVASGEQGFLDMMLNDHIIGKACCITPCWRNDRWDHFKRPYFMKVELINVKEPTTSNLIHMVHDAMAFYEKYLEVKVIETGPGTYDIVEKRGRIELGSYGIREYRGLRWIYGTGCAEPRLSVAVLQKGS